eukprot:3433853-Rhodomonas_salina.1
MDWASAEHGLRLSRTRTGGAPPARRAAPPESMRAFMSAATAGSAGCSRRCARCLRVSAAFIATHVTAVSTLAAPCPHSSA